MPNKKFIFTPKIYPKTSKINSLLSFDVCLMKTEKEIGEYRTQIEERLVKNDSMDAMKYYQGVLRTLEWVITGKDV